MKDKRQKNIKSIKKGTTILVSEYEPFFLKKKQRQDVEKNKEKKARDMYISMRKLAEQIE